LIVQRAHHNSSVTIYRRVVRLSSSGTHTQCPFWIQCRISGSLELDLDPTDFCAQPYLVDLREPATVQFIHARLTFVPQTLPIRVSIDIYDRHIRAIFPKLPSIRNLLGTIRSVVLSIFTSPPTRGATTSSRRPQGRPGNNVPEAPLRTLNVDLNALPADGS
jgi:hypothetical protein